MTTYDELENTLIETEDDDGNVVKFEVIDVLELDGQEYGILLPYNEEEPESDDDEEGEEAIVMKLLKEGDGYIFERIDDDAEFERVAEYFESIKEEM